MMMCDLMCLHWVFICKLLNNYKMSKIKKEIARVINEVKKSTQYTYGARFYEASQVVHILTDLLDADDTESETGAAISTEMVEDLVDKLKRAVRSSCDDMTDSSIVDEGSLEVSISGTSASIDSIEVDKEFIGDTAVEDIESTVDEWLSENDIVVSE